MANYPQITLVLPCGVKMMPDLIGSHCITICSMNGLVFNIIVTFSDTSHVSDPNQFNDLCKHLTLGSKYFVSFCNKFNNSNITIELKNWFTIATNVGHLKHDEEWTYIGRGL